MIKFYNTLTKKKEVFRPLHKGEVRMYNCGPTTYSYAHIGNFRAYVFADLLRRYLEWRGLEVKQVMNITDVGHMTFDDVADSSGEDKIEKAARKEGRTPEEIARFFEKAFFEDSDKLNIKKARVYPRATEHIKEMITLIERLLKKGYAYQAGDSVYFSVDKFKGYGKLSGNTIDQLMAGKRVCINEEKKNPYDFALWIKNPDHIMQWDSLWGRGYPGWHIECSAMSMKYLGETLDIHTGGEDNIFPHHECEIAQSEGATGKPFVRYWLHTRHLMVESKKMSKSLGNFYTLRDLIEKGHTPKAIRFLLLSAHYRTKLNLTEDALRQADQNVKTLERLAAKLREVRGGKAGKSMEEPARKLKEEFRKALDDDLNISLALANMFGFVREANKALDKGTIGQDGAETALKTLLDIDRVLGLGLDDAGIKEWHTPEEAEARVKDLIMQRELYRKEKEWGEADRIRDELGKEGIVLEDGKEGVKWKTQK